MENRKIKKGYNPCIIMKKRVGIMRSSINYLTQTSIKRLCVNTLNLGNVLT